MKQKRKHTTIVCQQCGIEKSVRLDAVKNQGQRFCSQKCAGAWAKENVPKGKDHWRYNRQEIECDNCGESMLRPPCEIENYNYCSRECLGKHQSKIRIGENASNWQGGITSLFHSIRHNKLSKEWRLGVFERDNYTCVRCNQKGGELNAHHKMMFSEILQKYGIDNLDDAMNCEALWDISNGETLCVDCHKIEHKILKIA